MVAVEHVLDLENTVNFDRHTSVLAPYCNCWEAPSAKSDPGSSQAASRGVESPPKSRFLAEKGRAVLEGMSTMCACMQHCARALPKALGRKSKKNRPPEHCRKAVRQQRFAAPQRALSNCEVGEGGLGKSRSFPIKDF